MTVRIGLAMIVMIASALAWIEAGQPQRARSLLRVARPRAATTTVDPPIALP